MEDYAIDIIIGKGPSANSIRLDLPKFTLIGATTRSGQLTAPLRDRFGVTFRLELYTEEELKKIVREARGFSALPSTKTVRWRSLPVQAGLRGSRIACSDACAISPSERRRLRQSRDRERGAAAPEVDGQGLDALDRRMLRASSSSTAAGRWESRPLRLPSTRKRSPSRTYISPISCSVNLTRTQRGRCVTRRAYEHLGIEFIGQEQLNL